jgi:hypothetical protein
VEVLVLRREGMLVLALREVLGLLGRVGVLDLWRVERSLDLLRVVEIGGLRRLGGLIWRNQR